LEVGLVAEARELGVNVSQAAEIGIAAAVARRRQERWLAENQDALQSSNAFAEQHGLPLAQYRNF
jgi:antitoxin CcdA